jgi:hypothetical protein
MISEGSAADPPELPATHRRMYAILRRASTAVVILLALCAAVGFWNSVKPLPPGMHVRSLEARLAESDAAFLTPDVAPQRVLTLIDHAVRLVVLDLRSGDTRAFAALLTSHLLARKRARPNLQILLTTDPLGEAGRAARSIDLRSIEAAGIIVARTQVDRLRDSNPVFSAPWRVLLAWWIDALPAIGLQAWLRLQNGNANQRAVAVADDGNGGWVGIVLDGETGVQVGGALAADIAAAELRVAVWSTDDDRLPAAPAVDRTDVGSIDARYLTEGAVRDALLETLRAAGGGDELCIATGNLAQRRLVEALKEAARRGAAIRLLLPVNDLPNQATAGELVREGAGAIIVRWRPPGDPGPVAKLLLARHAHDVMVEFGSADFTRRGLDDENLTANLELRVPQRSALARTAVAFFDGQWASAAAYEQYSDESASKYWRYRLLEATGLPLRQHGAGFGDDL